MRGVSACALFLLAVLAAPVQLTAGPLSVTGADGRTVSVADASRIVSIGGTVTEILYALGAEDRIVGVDLTSTFPSQAAAKPKIGYMRALSAEGVLSLAPTLVLAIEDAGPRETIEVLQRASVPFLLIPKANDAAGVGDTIRVVAAAIGEPEKGSALAEAVLADLAAVEAMLGRVSDKRKAAFVLGVSGGSPMVAGSGTSAADIFALAHVDNALAGIDGYKRVSDEASVAAAPDAVVLMAERSHAVSDSAVLATPAFNGSPAALNGQLIRLDGSYLLNFGPRTAHAARDLAAALYPELDLPRLPDRPWTLDQGTER